MSEDIRPSDWDQFAEGPMYDRNRAMSDHGYRIRARKTLWVGADGYIYVTKKMALENNGSKSRVRKMNWDNRKRRYMYVLDES